MLHHDAESDIHRSAPGARRRRHARLRGAQNVVPWLVYAALLVVGHGVVHAPNVANNVEGVSFVALGLPHPTVVGSERVRPSPRLRIQERIYLAQTQHVNTVACNVLFPHRLIPAVAGLLLDDCPISEQGNGTYDNECWIEHDRPNGRAVYA